MSVRDKLLHLTCDLQAPAVSNNSSDLQCHEGSRVADRWSCVRLMARFASILISNSRILINLKACWKRKLRYANKIGNYITFDTNLLHESFINYCCDMFRPQCSAIFREIKILCSLYFNLLGRSFTHMTIIIFKVEIKVLKHLTLVYTIQNISVSILIIILISPSGQAVLELFCWD